MSITHSPASEAPEVIKDITECGIQRPSGRPKAHLLMPQWAAKLYGAL